MVNAVSEFTVILQYFQNVVRLEERQAIGLDEIYINLIYRFFAYLPFLRYLCKTKTRIILYKRIYEL